ncbi:MAG: methyltransferase [Cyanobacteria bacterium P01_G01_bin.54]
MSHPFPVAPVDDRLLFDLSCQRVIGPVITVAQELNLFRHLHTQPCTIADLAVKFQTLPLISEALVAVLAAVGLLQHQGEGQFGLTASAETYMLPESPFFYSGFCPPRDWYLDLLRLRVMSGGIEPPMPRAINMKQQSPEFAQSFTERMHMMTLPAAARLAQQSIFGQLSTLLDVGGGSGSLSLAIADQNSQLQCTVMDLDPVCQVAAQNIETYGLGDRIKTLSRDMFQEPWPTAMDGVLFGNVFHDWDPDNCQTLAHHAFAALKPGGTILLHEMPLAETLDGPLTVACLSALLLMHERGKQYTLTELESLLTTAGFVDFQATPSHVYYQMISATKPG